MPTIVITGGHHNSALVVAKELVKKGFHVVWVGHRYSTRGDIHDSAEYLEVTSAGIPFHHLKAGKIDSTPTFDEIVNIPLGFIRAWRLLKQIEPVAVLSFGGYLGLAVSLSANLLQIPVYLHEQTMWAGKANRLAGYFARQIFLAWESASVFFPKGKSSYVGLPLRAGLLSAQSKQLFLNSLPTILVLGGKQGSHILNTHLFAILPRLLSHYNLIHQTGTNSVTGDYEAAVALKNTLNPELAPHYLPLGYINENSVGEYLASCDLYLGRSGAHITYELAYFGRKCLLVPFIYTTGSEQYLQAKYLQKAGLALILPQSELSAPSLLSGISSALKLPEVPTLTLPQDVAKVMVHKLSHDLKL
ncbi:MAG: glycosyltransferase [bacterium]